MTNLTEGLSLQARPALPEALPISVADNHTHLDYEPDELVVELLERARSVGVRRVIQIGCGVQSSLRTVELAQKHPMVVGGVAIHPNEAPVLAQAGDLEKACEQIAEIATHPRVVAIGETGLDYFRTDSSDGDALGAQQDSFRWHIALAKRLGKPMQIHNRQADHDTLSILSEQGAPEKTVFHCFSSDAEVAAECVSRGYYLSFAGNVTFKNAHALRESVRMCPLDRLLVETDAPYLTPVPYRGKVNASYLLPFTVQAIADIREASVEEVCEGVNVALSRLYGEIMDDDA